MILKKFLQDEGEAQPSSKVVTVEVFSPPLGPVTTVSISSQTNNYKQTNKPKNLLSCL